MLVSSWSFCLVEFNDGRSKVGPNTMAKLWSDILFSLSWSWTLPRRKDKRNHHFNKHSDSKFDVMLYTHLKRWSKMKLMVTLFWGGTSTKIFDNSWLSSFSLILLNWLNVSMNRRYNTSVNSVSGSSRKYALKIPVTEWTSTSFKNCSAS